MDTRAGRALLRPPRPEDAPALHAIVLATLAEGRWFVSEPDELPYGPEGLYRRVAALDGDDNGVGVVAEVQGEVAGFVTVTGGLVRRLRHVGRLEVYVAEAWRGRGLGRALVEDAVRRAEASPVLRKLSLAVFADNDRAIALYRSCGFVEEGRRVGEYRERDGTLRDDLLMARPVG